MGKIIRNDLMLTNLLRNFFERLAKRCDLLRPGELYLALTAEALSAETDVFFASLEVTHYGHLAKDCINTLPPSIDPAKILKRVYNDLDQQQSGLEPHSSTRVKNALEEELMSPLWPISKYGYYDDKCNAIIIGNRHPRRTAQEALRHAAKFDSDRLYDKAIEAIKHYISLDISQYEACKRNYDTTN